MKRNVVVWGNCQAEPLAALLTEPLARVGLTVVPVPPVFLTDTGTLARVQALVGGSAFLLSQPIRDEYRVRGCGTDQLAAHLPPQGRLIRLPSAFDAAAFPFQALAHDGTGERIAAPLTDYHDLRIIVAAAHGIPAEAVLENWPVQPSVAAFEAHAQHSWDALTTRETGLDVAVSRVIRHDAAMFSVNHPSNRTLCDMADGVLRLLGFEESVIRPEREFLGSTRTAVESVPAEQLAWAPTRWQVNGAAAEPEHIVRSHLEFYRGRPDVVEDALTRFGPRLDLLELIP